MLKDFSPHRTRRPHAHGTHHHLIDTVEIEGASRPEFQSEFFGSSQILIRSLLRKNIADKIDVYQQHCKLHPYRGSFKGIQRSCTSTWEWWWGGLSRSCWSCQKLWDVGCAWVLILRHTYVRTYQSYVRSTPQRRQFRLTTWYLGGGYSSQ
jgi:hypothetical protein